MRRKAIETVFPFIAVLLLVLPGAATAGSGENDPRVKAAFDRGWALFGQMHKDMKNLDLAIAQYREVLSIYPDNSDAHWKMAEAVFKKGQFARDEKKKKEFLQEALGYAEKGLSIDPQKPEPRYFVAVSSVLLAQMEGTAKSLRLVNRAKKELRTILALDPKSRFIPLSKAMLAAIYLDAPWPLRDLDAALKLSRAAVADDPNLTWASSILGRVYAKQGKTELAQKELSRCLAISKPTYVWDSILYDWPGARAALADLK